jgi:hypothetical protein
MKTISEILENIKPIKGFHVMEWLRGVRDANYELSIKDPEEYRRREEQSKKRIQLLERRAKRKGVSSRKGVAVTKGKKLYAKEN